MKRNKQTTKQINHNTFKGNLNNIGETYYEVTMKKIIDNDIFCRTDRPPLKLMGLDLMLKPKLLDHSVSRDCFFSLEIQSPLLITFCALISSHPKSCSISNCF